VAEREDGGEDKGVMGRTDARARDQSITAKHGIAFTFKHSCALVVCWLSFPSLADMSKPTPPFPKARGIDQGLLT
jgi:hypothetical protein